MVEGGAEPGVKDGVAPTPEGAFDRAALCAIVDAAKRAPSPLNTQPARWRLRDGYLELLEDPSRRLFASDASGHEHRLALGAAWEATRLALGTRGLRLVDELGAHVADAGVVARARVTGGGERDPLADAMARRATWRGRFRRVDDASRAALGGLGAGLARDGAVLIMDPRAVHEAAAAIDDELVRALLLPRALEELTDWIRSPRHPSAGRDGMTARTLRLTPWTTAVLARPQWFRRLARLGLARGLVSESSETASAAALVAITAPVDEPPFVSGGRCYRAWLRLTAAGLQACPMRVLTNTAQGRARFGRLAGVDGDRRLVHLWRVGVADGDAPPGPRLPTEELVL